MSKETASEKMEEKEIVIDVDDAEPTIEDLPGVGPATAEKLREALCYGSELFGLLLQSERIRYSFRSLLRTPTRGLQRFMCPFS